MASDAGRESERTAVEVADAVRRGDREADTVLEETLDRIDARNDSTGAFVTVSDESAREQAHAVAEAVTTGRDPGPLAGVPVAIKDLQPVAGVRTTFGSAAFADHVAERDSILVERLREAGAVIVGKTNTPEFGHKGTTDNRPFGPTTSPYDPECNAGGSSGGSAAAVAQGLAPLAQGGDGGGSIRIPAACCNVFGFKPSFGRVPHATRPDAFSEHTPFVSRGPLARTVADAARFLDVVVGPDDRDPLSLPEDGVEFAGAAAAGDAPDALADCRLALAPTLGMFPVEDAVAARVETAAAGFREAGATVERAAPSFEHGHESLFDAWRVGYEVLNAHLASMLEDEHGVEFTGADRAATSDAFVALVEAGREHSALDARAADRVRTSAYDAVRRLFEEYDLLLTPTLGTASVPQDGPDTLGPSEVAGESVNPLVGWALTWPFNMTGHPAASVPAGFLDARTPVGMQVVGPRHADERVLRAAAAFERVRPWTDAYPPREHASE